MIRIKYIGKIPEYLDGFPERCKRSCKGSIHLLPGSIKSVTPAEWDYIQKEYKHLAIQRLPDEKQPVQKIEPILEKPKQDIVKTVEAKIVSETAVKKAKIKTRK